MVNINLPWQSCSRNLCDTPLDVSNALPELAGPYLLLLLSSLEISSLRIPRTSNTRHDSKTSSVPVNRHHKIMSVYSA